MSMWKNCQWGHDCLKLFQLICSEHAGVHAWIVQWNPMICLYVSWRSIVRKFRKLSRKRWMWWVFLLIVFYRPKKAGSSARLDEEPTWSYLKAVLCDGIICRNVFPSRWCEANSKCNVVPVFLQGSTTGVREHVSADFIFWKLEKEFNLKIPSKNTS